MEHRFAKYARKGFAEARAASSEETLATLCAAGVSVSEADSEAFDSVPRGMVFRNPEDHSDQWYVALEWFQKNYDTTPM